jgi:hypothetical protein
LGQGVFDKIRFYVNLFFFILLLCWYLVKLAPFLHKKIPKLFGDLRWYIYGPRTCCFIIFFYVYCFLCCMFNLRTIIVKYESVMQCIFFSCLKRVNKKGKQKEKA